MQLRSALSQPFSSMAYEFACDEIKQNTALTNGEKLSNIICFTLADFFQTIGQDLEVSNMLPN